MKKKPLIIATDNSVIDALGGPAACCELVRERLGIRLNQPAVRMWRRRGIPWRYRLAIHSALQERGISIPKDFIEHRRVA